MSPLAMCRRNVVLPVRGQSTGRQCRNDEYNIRAQTARRRGEEEPGRGLPGWTPQTTIHARKSSVFGPKHVPAPFRPTRPYRWPFTNLMRPSSINMLLP